MATAISLSFALFTPLQSGEVLKVELLKKHGMMQRSPGYGSFLVEKALDLVTVIALACVSLLTTLDVLPRRYSYGILGGLAMVCLAGFLVIHKLQLKGRPQRLLASMRQCIGDGRTLAVVTLVTLASWAAVAFSWQILLYSAGLHLSFTKAIAVMSIVALISILSLIPGGLGISEAGTAQVLMRLGFTAVLAQAGALILRSYSILAILLAAVHLATWKLMIAHRGRQIAIAASASSQAASVADSDLGVCERS
jgi:uncharacterized membrane protein YbhN (UPF0104 family)